MHCILEYDRGAVGFVQQLGKTWHQLEQYKEYDGSINIETVESILNYDVEKVQACLPDGRIIPTSFALVRTDINEIIFPNVGDRYTVIKNGELLSFLNESILKPYKNITVESCGTLNNGQRAFINLMVHNHTIKGDISPTVTRLMYTNAFGMKAMTTCLHQTRVVCNNTLRIANAQGKANGTLKNFRHTPTAKDKLQTAVLDLADLVGEINEHNKALDFLSEQNVSVSYVHTTLEALFPGRDEVGAGATRNKNKQDAVLELFESKPDLVDLAHSKYRLFNAVTDYASHSMQSRTDDNAHAFLNVIEGGGDELNQQAFKMLLTV